MVHHVVPGWLGVLTHFIFVGCCCSLCRKVMCSCWETTATTALIPTTGTSQTTVIRPVTLEMHRYAWILSNVLPLQGSTSSEEHCREIYPPVLAAIEDQWYNLWAWCVPPRGAVLVVVVAVMLDIQCVCTMTLLLRGASFDELSSSSNSLRIFCLLSVPCKFSLPDRFVFPAAWQMLVQSTGKCSTLHLAIQTN